MKAVICTKYGGPDVLKIQEIDKPQPKKNEILVKIYASSITTAESMMRKGTPKFARLFLGINKPKSAVTGTGFSGVVESTGTEVTQFKIGDKVFGETTLGIGTNAEYISIVEDGLILKKPEYLSFEVAATLSDGALTSMNFLKALVKINPGNKVLINGAAGSIGTSAIQLAKQFGAHVTGVCSSKNINLVKSLGADHIIDYTKESFTNHLNTYDIIFDTVGKSTFCTSKKALKNKGIYLSPVLNFKLLFQALLTSAFSSKKAIFSATGLKPVKERKTLLKELLDMIEKKSLNTIIDKIYPFENVVDAHQYVDTGHKIGNVVLVHEIEALVN